jgi:hypothetical protein
MPVKVALAVAAAAMSAAAAVGSGVAARNNAKSEMRQLGQQRDAAAVAAEDDSLTRSRQLAQVTAASRASFAARGLDPDSGTPALFAERQGALAAEDASLARYNDLTTRNLYRLSINQSATNGRNAMALGVLKAGGSLLGAASSFKGAGGGGGEDKTRVG